MKFLPIELFKTSVGKKHIMAVTGLMLVGFVVAHLLGNLQVFLGQNALNDYAKHLRELGPILMGMRLGLLGIFAIHIVTALTLAFQNRAARPERYRHEGTVQATYVSRLMVVSGCLILLYVIVHLGHFTWHWFEVSPYEPMDAQGRHNVYGMVVSSFQSVPVSVAYILAMVALYMHLSHAAVVFGQSLGVSDAVNLAKFKLFGRLFAAAIFIGYVSIPAAILAGVVK